jgi:SNF2 family DNA or RNA helicase
MRLQAQLYPYQCRAAQLITERQSCAIWADVGLGKSAITLTAFSTLYSQYAARRMLVIAPLRVARKTWRDEAAEWQHTKHLHVATIVGTPEQRMKALRTPADVHCVNYDVIDWLEAQFIQHGKQTVRWPWDLVALDEAHRVKDQSTVRWKMLRKVRRLFPRLVELTGTPSPNGYADLWAQIYLLDQGKRLGFTEDAYKQRWFDPPGFGDYSPWRLKHGADKEIQEAIADLILTLRAEDYMDLPPISYNPIRVELQPHQKKLYREFERKMIAEVGGQTLTAPNSAALNQKLLQLANGVVYAGVERAIMEIHGEKLSALEEVLEDLGDKQVMISYYFKHDLARIKAVLEKYRRRNWRVLRTEQDEDDWNAGKIQWLLVHPDSAGEGVNLHKSGCEDIVWYGMTPSLLQWQQLNGRLFGGVRRLGKNGRVHYISADGTIDEDYRDLLSRKDTTQEGLKEALARRIQTNSAVSTNPR